MTSLSIGERFRSDDRRRGRNKGVCSRRVVVAVVVVLAVLKEL